MKWLLAIIIGMLLAGCTTSSAVAGQLANETKTVRVETHSSSILPKVVEPKKKKKLILICPVGEREVVATFNGITRNHPEGGHKGYDFEAPIGTVVEASAGGVITEVGGTPYNTIGYSDSLGIRVKIQHEDGRATVYAHLSKVLVEEGQRVKQYDPIAETGNSGYSEAPHLHFEVWSSDGEERINPLPFLHKKKYKKVYETIFASKKAVWVNTTCTK